ncbi:MAG: MFS transporter [Chloroflexota bacterium]
MTLQAMPQPPREDRSKKIFQLYYFLSYVGIASLYPYLSIFFQEHGRSDTQIGLIFAVASIGGVLAQPVLGLLADRASDYRRILALSVGLSPLIALGYFFSPTYWLLLVTALALSVVQSIATPLSDAVTAELSGVHTFTFGQVRLWGSLGFALATALGGYLYSRVGYGAGFLAFPAVSALIVACLPFLPKKRAVLARGESIRQNVRALRANRALLTFIALAFLVAVASAVNGQLFPLYYAAMHYDLQYLGLVFMIAAVIEIPLFRLSGSLLRQVGPGALIVISAFTYTAKWGILALGPPLWVVFAVQILDGIAYTFMTVGAVELIQVIGTPGLKSTGQSLYSAVNWSLSGIVGSIGGGYLFDHIGPAQTYLVLTFLSGSAGVGLVIYRFRMAARLGRSATESPG